jgi:DNA-binding CsgD family transcriptional regulator/PAS domain-containing protein
VTSEPAAAGGEEYGGRSAEEGASSAAFLDDELTAEAFSRAGVAVVQVDLATLRVTAVSEVAAALLGATPADLVGRPIEDFVVDEPTGAVPLLATGRLDGFEARRQLRRVDGAVVEAYVWAHVLGDRRPARYGAVVVTTQDMRPPGMLMAAAEDQKVIGTVDAEWRIDRISVDVEELLGYRAGDLAGASLLAAVYPSDLPELLTGLSHVHATGRGAAIRLRVRTRDNYWLWCRAHLSALEGSPGFAFSLRPQTDPRPSASDRSRELEMRLSRIAHETRAAGLTGPSLGVPVMSELPELATLTTREWEVAGALAEGSRVPTIARQLNVSPGTVRNHLSGVYRKLDVGSQAELLERLRSG